MGEERAPRYQLIMEMNEEMGIFQISSLYFLCMSIS